MATRDLDDTTDKALIQAVGTAQDRAAFDALVQRWDRRVFAFLAKAGGDVEAAADMRQEVFLRVWKYAASYNDSYAVSTWLYRIAHNVLHTWRAKRNGSYTFPLSDQEDTFEAPGSYRPDHSAITSEIDRRVRAAIDGFDVNDRELLLMRIQSEMPYREIGEVLGIPETTAKSRSYKLMAKLREQLADLHAVARSSS
jgi:RNA polymerase sigma-70 factor (ECF subfamily)